MHEFTPLLGTGVAAVGEPAPAKPSLTCTLFTLQPIVGGFVIMNASWHWIFWILTIVSSVSLHTLCDRSDFAPNSSLS
jgi:hypothetical protein